MIQFQFCHVQFSEFLTRWDIQKNKLVMGIEKNQLPVLMEEEKMKLIDCDGFLI